MEITFISKENCYNCFRKTRVKIYEQLVTHFTEMLWGITAELVGNLTDGGFVSSAFRNRWEEAPWHLTIKKNQMHTIASMKGLECSKRAENIINRKVSIFYIETVLNFFSTPKNKFSDIYRKKYI